MHGHHENFFTALLNQYVAGPANALRNAVGLPASDPAKPWADWMGTELLVVLILMAGAALLRPRLSVANPGAFQHAIESVFGFIRGTVKDVVGHGYHRHVAFVATLFLFILGMNLIDVIPAFQPPTMFAAVPLGCAIATFVYFNVWGVKEQGLGGYLKHFAGPMPALSWFIFPLEFLSMLIRPVSLTIRLYANMLAGDQVSLAFISMGLLFAPLAIAFKAMHLLVAFVQAFIFMMLTTVYVGAATEHEEH
jgi:F-type H+-transporting ATPase subunit a